MISLILIKPDTLQAGEILRENLTSQFTSLWCICFICDVIRVYCGYLFSPKIGETSVSVHNIVTYNNNIKILKNYTLN